jgi:hypothetical protein
MGSDGPLSPPVRSTSSILAILCAIGSFAFVDNAAGKMLLAALAVLFGLVGVLRSTSPRFKGGLLSVVAIVIAVLGLLAALLDAIGLF